jgi:hypothetical protein
VSTADILGRKPDLFYQPAPKERTVGLERDVFRVRCVIKRFQMARRSRYEVADPSELQVFKMLAVQFWAVFVLADMVGKVLSRANPTPMSIYKLVNGHGHR